MNDTVSIELPVEVARSLLRTPRAVWPRLIGELQEAVERCEAEHQPRFYVEHYDRGVCAVPYAYTEVIDRESDHNVVARLWHHDAYDHRAEAEALAERLNGVKA